MRPGPILDGLSPPAAGTGPSGTAARAIGRGHREMTASQAVYENAIEAEIEARITPGPPAASQARDLVAGLAPALGADMLDDVRLVVSELVTNSLRHANLAAGDRILLRIHAGGNGARIEVDDPGQGFRSERPEPSSDLMSGWGLYLVDQISARWGVVQDGTTHVWCELDRS